MRDEWEGSVNTGCDAAFNFLEEKKKHGASCLPSPLDRPLMSGITGAEVRTVEILFADQIAIQ